MHKQKINGSQEYRLETPDEQLQYDIENLELKKMNRILLATIESLEKELGRTKERALYLENDNRQLYHTRNDLYQEKEDLIKRSIDFEYLKQRLEDKDRRLKEAENDNAKHLQQISQMQKDNEILRNEMEGMRQLVQKLATSRMNFTSREEFISKNQEIFESLNAFAGRMHSNPDESAESINIVNDSNFNNMNYELESENKVHETQQPSQRRPMHKILKKKPRVGKQTKLKRKYQILNELKEHSPLTKNEMKLLHDPASFEKYARELDLDLIKATDLGYKKNFKYD